MLAYSNIAYSIINDANRGTLEQLNMSNISLSQIVIVRSFSNLLLNIVFSIVLFSLL